MIRPSLLQFRSYRLYDILGVVVWQNVILLMHLLSVFTVYCVI